MRPLEFKRCVWPSILHNKMAETNDVVLACLLFFYLLHMRSRRSRRRLNDLNADQMQSLTDLALEFDAFRTAERGNMHLLWIVLGHINASVRPIHRTVWTRERSDYWWRTIVMRSWNSRDWIENFRMTKDTFMYICTRLRRRIQRVDTRMRRAVSVELRVGITLWRLSTNCDYRTIGHLFGIARSTACEIVHETCQQIIAVFLKSVIRFPTGNELERVVDGFQQRWGFPQVAGAIDATHIPILAPENYPNDYFNRKSFHSVLVQAVVDDKYCFTDVCVGWPGSVHDARVYSNSRLYQLLSENRLLPNRTRQISGVDIPIMLIGDPAYPLQKHLMKAYSDTGRLTEEEVYYNRRLSRARMVVENAFGRLKGRWRSLMKRNDCQLEGIPTIVTTCCILHNLCEREGNPFYEQWLDNNNVFDVPNVPVDDRDEGFPAQVRRALVQYCQDNRL
ncbi:uncharacterized protein [Ptychodera flava]|uniref:uncharacterized protein n=1 Tax=Ptychodera flava TaxID=63121 RepID=UPI00396AABCC